MDKFSVNILEPSGKWKHIEIPNLLIDLSTTEIKNIIFTYLFPHFFVPPHFQRLSLESKKSKKEYLFDRYINLVKSKSGKETDLSDKIIKDGVITFSGKNVILNSSTVSQKPYTVSFLSDILDEIIKDEKLVDFELKNLTFNTINIVSVLDEIRLTTQNDIFNIILDDNSINNLFLKVKERGWVYLTKEDIIFILNVIILEKYNIATSSEKHMIELSIHLDEIKEKVDNYMFRINQDLSVEKNIINSRIHNLLIDVPDKKEIISYIHNTSVVESDITVTKRDEGNEYVNLEYIFNNFSLNPNVPYMSFNSGHTIKTSKEFSENIENKKLIKEWSVKEDNDGSVDFIPVKGLMFKIKTNEPGRYITANLYKNGRFTTRCSWKAKEELDSNNNKVINTCAPPKPKSIFLME